MTDENKKKFDGQYIPVEVTEEEVTNFRKSYDNPSEELAKTVARNARWQMNLPSGKNNDFLSYKSLRDGTASILDQYPNYQDLSVEERKLSDNDILALLTNIEDPNYWASFAKAGTKSALATGVTLATAQAAGPPIISATTAGGTYLGGAAGSIVPFAGTAVGAGIGGATGALLGMGITGGISLAAGAGTYFMVGEGLDAVTPEDPVVNPNIQSNVIMVETLGDFMGGAYTPYMIGKGKKLENHFTKKYGDFFLKKDMPVSGAEKVLSSTDKILSEIGDQARKRPLFTGFTEILSAGGASFLAREADQYSPDSVGLRLMGELVGSSLTPIVAMKVIGQKGKGALQSGVNFAGTRMQRKSFEKINKIFSDYSTTQDYDALINNLKINDLDKYFPSFVEGESTGGIPFTAAQVGDNPILSKIEARVANKYPELGAKRTKNYNQALEVFKEYTNFLKSTGNDQLIEDIAKAKSLIFEDELFLEMRAALSVLDEADKKLSGGKKGSPTTREELSEKMYAIIKDTYKKWGAKEKEAYGLIPNFSSKSKKPFSFLATLADNLPKQGKYRNALIDDLKNETPLLFKIAGEVQEEFEKTGFYNFDYETMIDYRSALLSLSRKLGAESPESARIVSKVADSILDDIDSSVKNSTLTAAEKNYYDDARSLTRAKKDVFDRSIGRNVVKKNRLGGIVSDPLTFLSILGSNRTDITLNNTRKLQELGRRADKNGIVIGDGTDVFTSINDVTEGYLRNLRKFASVEKYDSATGTTKTVINDDLLQRWKKENSDLIELFPAFSDDLDNAVSAQRAIEYMEKDQGRRRKQFDQVSYLSGLLKGKSPQAVFGKILNSKEKDAPKELRKFFELANADKLPTIPNRSGFDSKFPVRESSDNINKRLEALERLKKEGGGSSNIKEAMRATIIEYAFRASGGEANAFNPTAFKKFMYGPLSGRKESLMDIADEFGIFNKADSERLKLMSLQMDKAYRANNVKINSGINPEADGGLDPVTDFYSAVFGSAMGTKLFNAVGGTGPGTIVAAGKGSGTIRYLLGKLPSEQKNRMIQNVLMDPEMTALMLLKPKTDVQKVAWTKAMYETMLGLATDKGRQMTPSVLREISESPEVERELKKIIKQTNSPTENNKKISEALVEQEKNPEVKDVSLTVPDTAGRGLNRLAELGVDQTDLNRTIWGESKFKTDAVNKSGAYGLFQLMPDPRKRLGVSKDQLENMNADQQLSLFADYLKMNNYKAGDRLGIYLAAPSYSNKPENFEVYKYSTSPKSAYQQNPGWRGKDGKITVGSINDYYAKPLPNNVRPEYIYDKSENMMVYNDISNAEIFKFVKDLVLSTANASEYSNSGGTPVEAPQAYAPQAYALNDISNAVQPNTTSSVNSPRASNIRPNPVRQVATGPVTSPTTNPTAVGIQGSITPESAQRFAQVFGANDPVLTMGIGGLVR